MVLKTKFARVCTHLALFGGAVLWMLITSAVAATGTVANGIAAEMERQGQIEQVQISSNRLVVDGRSYRAAADVHVSIGGTYGAFTLLRPGMRVYVRYLQHANGERELVEVSELPAGQRVDQS